MVGQEITVGCKVAWGSRAGSCGAQTNVGEVIRMYDYVPSNNYRDYVLEMLDIKNLNTNKTIERSPSLVVRYKD